MEARMTEKCRGLAATAARAFRQQHQGKAPTLETDQGAFDPAWAVAWESLRGAGATADQEDECRQIFIEGFYTLQPAGGN